MYIQREIDVDDCRTTVTPALHLRKHRRPTLHPVTQT